MENDNLTQEIERIASNRASAKVYLMNNSYLNPVEKQEVEMWYGLPGNAMFYVFVISAICSLYNPLAWSEIIGISLIFNIIIGIWNWYFYNKKIAFTLYLTIFHSWIMFAVGISVAIFLFTKGAVILGIISLIAPFGLLVFLEPHLYFYSFLAQKYRMHPKYVFFKKEYSHEFPFEKDLG